MKEDKYWCGLGYTGKIIFGKSRCNRIITLRDCIECDKLAKFPVGSYVDCTMRKKYIIPIIEYLHDLVWWIKLMYEDTKLFLCFIAQHFIAPLIYCDVTTCYSKGRCRLIWGRIKRKKKRYY